MSFLIFVFMHYTHVHKYTSKIDCSKEVYIFLLYSAIYRYFSRTVEFLDASRIPIEKPLLFTITNIILSEACCCIELNRDKN